MPLIGTRKFPKGPSLRHLETHSFNLSGTRVKFLAPKHYHDAIPATPPHKEYVNLYEPGLFDRFDKKDVAEPPSYPIELKYWRFTGVPVLDGTGVLGDMRFHVSILDMPEFSSLFRPKHLECAIERCIYGSPYAYRTPGECRLDWKVTTINQSIWASYRSNHVRIEDSYSYESVWHTPITDQHLLTVRFKQGIGKKRTRLAEVYQKIIEQVMSSFEIQLSSDAQAQRDAVKAAYPDERLSETLPPYEFEIYELDNEYDLIDEIGAQHNFELPHEEIKKLWEIEKKRQRRVLRETRVRVIASHLRFKNQE